MSQHKLVTEWNTIDDAVEDAASVLRRVLDLIDEIGEVCQHARRMPDRMAAAPFKPGPEAEGKVHALVDATPDPKGFEDMADAATFLRDALIAVKATVGEQVESKGVSGEAKAFAAS